MDHFKFLHSLSFSKTLMFLERFRFIAKSKLWLSVSTTVFHYMHFDEGLDPDGDLNFLNLYQIRIYRALAEV